MSVRERTIRQYHRLRRLEKDQAGKPEGETAGRIADKLLAQNPELAGTVDPDDTSDRGSRGPAASRPGSPGYGFMDFMRNVAREFGLDEFDTLINDIERDFPGLIDEVVKQAQDNKKKRPAEAKPKKPRRRRSSFGRMGKRGDR
jgi:hypothetical protein